jgi:hypothetical protein
MVKVNWLSLLAPAKKHKYIFSKKLFIFWLFIFYRWIFYIYNPFEVKVICKQKLWTILSSPKCHKIGRYQIVNRYLRYQFILHFFHDKYVIYYLNHILILYKYLIIRHKFFMHNFIDILNFKLSLNCLLYDFNVFMWPQLF